MQFKLIPEEDAAQYLTLLTDPATLRNSMTVPPQPDLKWAKDRIRDREPYGLYDEVGLLAAEGSIFAAKNGGIEIGYCVSPHARGRGCAQTMLDALLGLLRSKGYQDKVYAGVAKDNPASLHILQKAGFEIYDEDVYYSQGRQCDVEGWLLVKEGL